MDTKDFSQLPRIAPADLARLTLDPVSAHHHERRFRSAMLPGMSLAFASLLAGFFLYHAGILSQNWGGVVCFAGGVPGLALALIGYRRVLRQQPLSAQSHRPMSAFTIQDRVRTDAVEVAYIDEITRTYFTRWHPAQRT